MRNTWLGVLKMLILIVQPRCSNLINLGEDYFNKHLR